MTNNWLMFDSYIYVESLIRLTLRIHPFLKIVSTKRVRSKSKQLNHVTNKLKTAIL